MNSPFFLISALVLMAIMSACSLRGPVSPVSAITWQNESKEWHQHYNAQSLEVATPLMKQPTSTDSTRLRISGIWMNRTNLNLWHHMKDAFVNQTPGLVHGYIDESNPECIPRFAFVGGAWENDAQAKTAKRQIKKAFSEWSSLHAGPSDETGLRLETGLEFRNVKPANPENVPTAEIELYWNPLPSNSAGGIDRQVLPNGTVTVTTLTFNAANTWWFGKAAETPPNRMHFYSTALHEVGHIVGLWESLDPTSVMISKRTSGPNGPAFDHIDKPTKQIAIALYSQPRRKGLCPLILHR